MRTTRLRAKIRMLLNVLPLFCVVYTIMKPLRIKKIGTPIAPEPKKKLP